MIRWIRTNIPDIGDPSNIVLKACRRIPFWWIPGNRHVAGVTLWHTVYVTEPRWPFDPLDHESVAFLFHELMHVAQFRRHPILFPLRYLADHWRYGYWNNPAEIEARDGAARMTSAYFLARFGNSSAPLAREAHINGQGETDQ